MRKAKMKNLFLLLLLAMMPPSPLSDSRMRRQIDVWGSWGEWSECSRSCGGGVSFRQRRCYSQRTEGGSSCTGPTQSYRSCNIQSCPEGSRDFRAEQCAEFDGTEFEGKKYKWLPYYGAPNKCELNCIPKGENFYYRHKEAVVDGTTCEPGKRDICVEGVCQAVGCDNMLDSAKKEDKCLQCGGDGSTCYGVKGNFDVANLPKGYNQIFIIPMGATSIHIKEVKPSRNFLAIKNVRGEYYLNGHWTIDSSRALRVASTVLHYERGAGGDLAPELLHARGPTTEPLVIELISQEPNPGVQYEYYLPVQGQSAGYSWSYSSWSECSSECGGGFQSRLVFCTIDNEIYPDYMCRNKPQPDNNRTCGRQACPQTKRTSYIYLPRAWNHSGARSSQTKRWKTGEWGPCSATCGGGTQSRSVYCMAFDGESAQGAVDTAECMAFAQQPRSSQPCNTRQCASWSTGPWSECSVSCGEGVRTRSVACRTQQGAQAQDLACLLQPKPPATQPCLGESCMQEIGWHVGDWGLCSKSCDSGIRTRQVICADGDSKFYNPEMCKAIQPQKPATLGGCNMQPCYLPQQVPSMQDTTGYDVTRQSLLTRYNPNSPATDPDDEGMRPGTSVAHGSSGNHQVQSEDRGPNLLPLRWESQSRSSGSRQLSFPGDLAAGTNTQDCNRSPHGCCPDGHTPASGPLGRGCPFGTCQQSRYGCCPDGISSAQGPDNMGCPQYYSDVRVNRSQPTAATSVESPASSQQHPPGECRASRYGCCFDNIASASGPQGEGCRDRPSYPFPVLCLLPSAHGPCADWSTRWYFVAVVGKCNRFWYGGCHGNRNSFASEEECMRACQDREGLGQQGPAGSFPARTLHRAILEEGRPTLVTVAVGQNIQLFCKMGTFPFSHVEWMKDGRPFSSDRHSYQSDSSLVISHVSSEDAGTYTCLVSSGRTDGAERRQVQLQISEYQGAVLAGSERDRAAHKEDKQHGEQSRGSDTEPAAGSSVRQQLTYRWRKWDFPGRRMLLLLEATQSCPPASGDFLPGAGELRITGLLPSITVSEGETALLHCTVSGSDVTIRWSRNGVPMRADGHHIHLAQDGSLTIKLAGWRRRWLLWEGNGNVRDRMGRWISGELRADLIEPLPSRLAAAAVNDVVEGSSECVDQPHLANCELIVQAQLCGNRYYGSFCCASCARQRPGPARR
ncbi:PREDICTED: papilin [Tinamus guttatus]|uniref:papilin n=1 Tax=Tinamus guttatus TaxID=94827 RepID=UPI00052E7AE6|nr:PREDICTED: papilin [Tinamus guttatus]